MSFAGVILLVAMMYEGKLNELIKPFSWLIGKWKSDLASGSFPGIKDFTYLDVIEFETCNQQPSLKFTASSSHPINLNPMHLETGFLRARGVKGLSLMAAHNFGLTTLEEGTYNGQEIILKSVNISRMSDSKEPAVLATERKLKLEGESLTYEFWMSTSKTTELTKHLVGIYKRVA